MHMDRSAQNLQPTSIQRTTTDDGGEPHTDNITSRCTTLCGDLRIGRSWNVFEILDSHLEYVQICVKDNDLNC
jgi:hypothetical protein